MLLLGPHLRRGPARCPPPLPHPHPPPPPLAPNSVAVGYLAAPLGLPRARSSCASSRLRLAAATGPEERRCGPRACAARPAYPHPSPTVCGMGCVLCAWPRRAAGPSRASPPAPPGLSVRSLARPGPAHRQAVLSHGSAAEPGPRRAGPPVYPAVSSTHRKVVSYKAHADASDGPGGHGTHVVGSILGSLPAGPDAAPAVADFSGMAPAARLAFFDIQARPPPRPPPTAPCRPHPGRPATLTQAAAPGRPRSPRAGCRLRGAGAARGPGRGLLAPRCAAACAGPRWSRSIPGPRLPVARRRSRPHRHSIAPRGQRRLAAHRLSR